MAGDNGIVLRAPSEDLRVRLARERLYVARQEVGHSIAAVRTEIAIQTDWVTWYRARPEVFLGAAFLVGFLLAHRR